MADCEKLSKCPFFGDKLANMPSAAALMKQSFCHDDKNNCARYLVASQGMPVPADLFPNDPARARQILSRNEITR
jgi:hypothetical protein